jgi:hypothetical protein
MQNGDTCLHLANLASAASLPSLMALEIIELLISRNPLVYRNKDGKLPSEIWTEYQGNPMSSVRVSMKDTLSAYERDFFSKKITAAFKGFSQRKSNMNPSSSRFKKQFQYTLVRDGFLTPDNIKDENVKSYMKTMKSSAYNVKYNSQSKSYKSKKKTL